MRMVVVAGARPQFVKAAALVPALRARGEVLFVHSGQHPDAAMVETHFAGLDLPEPDHKLTLEHSDRVPRLAEMVSGLSAFFEETQPDWVFSLGDADSAVAAAVAASFCEIRLAHVEAGARSGERDLPEERNRKIVDELSNLLFCATDHHALNLEGCDGVHVVGDVMADVLLSRRDQLSPGQGEYGVLTMHRAANADDEEAVARVLDAAGHLDCPVIFPRHPRTEVGTLPNNVEERPPLPYLDFLGLVCGARFVLTDSGGVQKEAYLLEVPCITMRGATEWGETIESGWNVLVGTDAGRIAAAAQAPPRGAHHPALYGDGHAADRIAELV